MPILLVRFLTTLVTSEGCCDALVLLCEVGLDVDWWFIFCDDDSLMTRVLHVEGDGDGVGCVNVVGGTR